MVGLSLVKTTFTRDRPHKDDETLSPSEPHNELYPLSLLIGLAVLATLQRTSRPYCET
jgi:hypothetical protein